MKKMIWIILLLLIGVTVLYAAFIFLPALAAGHGYSADEIKKVTVVAHRGGASLGPENTLACIEKGIEAGADMIEVDVHLTRDGALLVCHDQSIDRTTNGKGLIRDLTLAQIKSHRVVNADGGLTQEQLPTLEEVMTLVKGRCRLLIEIKRTGSIYMGIEAKVLDVINRFDARDWVVVQSFNDSVLETLHRLSPTQRLEKLIIFKFPLLPLIFDGTLTGFNYQKYSYIASFNFYKGALSPSLAKSIHAHGKEVKVWTLDGPQEAPHLPVDAVITNRPDLWK